MPVFTAKDTVPAWCDLKQFEILRLAKGSTAVLDSPCNKHFLIVAMGRLRLLPVGSVVEFREKHSWAGPHEPLRIEAEENGTVVLFCSGTWEEQTPHAGLFYVGEGDGRVRPGDKVNYEKSTAFDRHYHDCDEYWIVYEGGGTVWSEGKEYRVGPGDCVATGLGHHHDVSKVDPWLRGLWFECRWEREGRKGHLWEHEHGQAVPDPQRV